MLAYGSTHANTTSEDMGVNNKSNNNNSSHKYRLFLGVLCVGLLVLCGLKYYNNNNSNNSGMLETHVTETNDDGVMSGYWDTCTMCQIMMGSGVENVCGMSDCKNCWPCNSADEDVIMHLKEGDVVSDDVKERLDTLYHDEVHSEWWSEPCDPWCYERAAMTCGNVCTGCWWC